MFWSGNYTTNRELKFLLLEKNVTLTQVLEADDILQECKADYQTLSQFLSRPDILSELITLITEEPPKNVELSLQYRHANIACEVLTSNLSLLRDRLSSNSVQMNRLCDFVNKEPPLNPLLASYFSKTIDMLLEKSPKTDWYLHNIVCLRVLDFFKSRRDFVPNLLRHISTSAICDTFRCFLQTFNNTKIILEWLDEYHFLDCLIQIICGTYDPEEVYPVPPDSEDKATNEPNEKLDTNHNSEPEQTGSSVAGKSFSPVADGREAETNGEREDVRGGGEGGLEGGAEGLARDWRAAREERARRTRGVAAANAAALLCDIALDCGPDAGYAYGNPWGAGKELAARLRGEDTVRRVLQGCFTSPAGARRPAVVHACRLLLALLKRAPPAEPAPGAEAAAAEAEQQYREVELAVAPHLPLLHRALLKDVDEEDPREPSAARAPGGAGAEAGAEAGARRAAGAARVHVAALVARLALSDVDDVPTALISLGTAGVLIDLSFSCSHNNFLHAQLVALVRNARNNARFGDRYTTHLIEECNLLTRLMDAFEENESGKGLPARPVRAGYMGHVVLLLGELSARPPALAPGQLLQRWSAFREQRLKPLLLLHHAPLGGVYPQEDFQESKFTVTYDTLEKYFGGSDETGNAFTNFMASKHFNENVWDESAADELDDVDVLDDADGPEGTDGADGADGLDGADHGRLHQEAQRVLAQASPWEEAGSSAGAPAGSPEAAREAGSGGADEAEGWAQFDTPFNKYPFWAASHDPESPSLPDAMQSLRVSDDDKDALTILLAHKMLAFHNMAPAHYDAHTSNTHDGQTHIAIEEDQSSHGDQNHAVHSEENRNSQDNQNQRRAQDNQNQSINSVQIQSSREELHQSGKDDRNQSAHDGQNPSTKGQNQSAEKDQNQSAHDDQDQSAKSQNPSAEKDQNPSAKEGQNQSTHGGQNQSAHGDQDQSAKSLNLCSYDCENQSAKEVWNQSAEKDQNQSAKEGQNQSTHGGQNQSAHDDQDQSAKSQNLSSYDCENQSAKEGRKQSAEKDQNQSAKEGQNQSTKECQDQSAHDGQNQSAHDDQDQSAHETSSAYDNPSVDAES